MSRTDKQDEGGGKPVRAGQHRQRRQRKQAEQQQDGAEGPATDGLEDVGDAKLIVLPAFKTRGMAFDALKELSKCESRWRGARRRGWRGWRARPVGDGAPNMGARGLT